MRSRLIILPFLLLVCACVQTSSGADYMQRHGQDIQNSADDAAFKAKLMEAINVEPTLKFPARLGIARIENGKLVNVPSEEMAAWEKAQQSLGSAYGEFVPVRPLIAQMVTAGDKTEYDITQKIRLGAARQHLDAVLLYEVYANERRDDNLLMLGNITIIGAYILPSVAAESQSFASALLIDVASGYPYGSTEATVKKSETLTVANSDDEVRDLSKAAKTAAVEKLSDNTAAMVRELKQKLESR